LRGRATWDAFFIEQRSLVRDLPALEAQLQRIMAPATIVIGTADSVVSPRSARLLAGQLRAAELIEIEHGRHMLPAQIPERLAELMLAAAAVRGAGGAAGAPVGYGPSVGNQVGKPPLVGDRTERGRSS
jgi:pimeloyl-ACP methyl ester carboxylesterase